MIMIVYKENPKSSIDKCLQFINEFNNVANLMLIHKNALYFYISTIKRY